MRKYPVEFRVFPGALGIRVPAATKTDRRARMFFP